MSTKNYESQWFTILNKISKNGYSLSDCKLHLAPVVTLDLNDEIPLLRSTYVETHNITDLYLNILDCVYPNKFNFKRNSIVNLLHYKEGLLANFSCFKDVNNVLTFTLNLRHVNWLRQLPVLVPAIYMVCKKLGEVTSLDLGKLVITTEAAIIKKEDFSYIPKLLNSFKRLNKDVKYFKDVKVCYDLKQAAITDYEAYPCLYPYDYIYIP